MGSDPDDAELPAGAEDLADLVSPELRDEFLKVMQRLAARSNAPRTEDEHGNPLPQLDLENPPATPPDDPLLRVGYALLDKLPERWDWAMLQVDAAADEVRTLVMVYVEDECPPDPPGSGIHFFLDLAEPCLTLRRSMYKPDGQGAWYHAVIKLDRDGRLQLIFQPDVAPPFGTWGPREVELLLRDQELYPRDPEHLPPWHPAHW